VIPLIMQTTLHTEISTGISFFLNDKLKMCRKDGNLEYYFCTLKIGDGSRMSSHRRDNPLLRNYNNY
jgi:hypothetical protein